MRQGLAGGGRHQLQSADLEVEPILEKRHELGNRDRIEAEARQRFVHVAFVVAAQLGDLLGNLRHRSFERELIVGMTLVGIVVAHQATDAQVVRGVDGQRNPLEQRGHQMVTVGQSAQSVVEVGDCKVNAHRRHAGHPHHAQHVVISRGHADFGDRRNVVGQRRQTLPAAPPGESIQVGAGGAVVDLSRIAEGRGSGRNHDEEVERMPGGRSVKIQRAGRLGGEHRLHGFPGHGGEQTIIEHTGEVEDALQRPAQIGDAALDVPPRPQHRPRRCRIRTPGPCRIAARSIRAPSRRRADARGPDPST